MTYTEDRHTHLFEACGAGAATVAFVCATLKGSEINHMSLRTFRLYLLSEMLCLVVVDIIELGFALSLQVCFYNMPGVWGVVAYAHFFF